MDILNKLQTDFKAQQQILKLIGTIDEFKGKWTTVERQSNRYLKELKKIATVESIGSSTRIEGVLMTDEEIKVLLKDIRISKLKTRDEQEVFGYYEALEIIFANYDDIEISESAVKNLHNMLLKYSSKDKHHKGNYKTLSNKVVANYPDGSQRVIFNTTEPHLTATEMHNLVEWTNEQLQKQDIHPLLIISTFIYEFLSTHPFQDGNGRLSRLLTTLLLLKSGYPFIQYVSFESIIEKHKKEYYEALMSGQKNRNTPNEKITTWTVFFLQCLTELIQKLEEKYTTLQSKGGYLNERQKNVFDFIKGHQPVKLNDLGTHFKDISPNTLKKDLLYLKQENFIESIGKNKGTIYVIKTVENAN
ncbi:MAG: Fic family protein [Chitinophagales bacterium]|nr:Fic family protein [Chitinophagales bacterium]